MINQARRNSEPFSTLPKSKDRPKGSQGFGMGTRSTGCFNGFRSFSSPVTGSVVITDFLWIVDRSASPASHIIGGGTLTIN